MHIRRLYTGELRKIRGQYRIWLRAVTLLLIVVIAVSYGFLHFNPEQGDKVITLAASKLPTVREGEGIVGIVLARNLLATGFITFSGLLTLGIVPIVNLTANGFIIGALLEILSRRMQIHPLRVALFGILPHGLFELPAIILAGALGLRMGCWAWRWLTRRREQRLGAVLGDSFLTYCLVIAPLLLIAAIIEGTLTLWLIKFFLTTGHSH